MVLCSRRRRTGPSQGVPPQSGCWKPWRDHRQSRPHPLHLPESAAPDRRAEAEGLLEPTPVKALLVVDLPFGEEPAFEAELRAAGYPMVPLLSPTTTLDRARPCCRIARTRVPAALRPALRLRGGASGRHGYGQGTDLAPVGIVCRAENPCGSALGRWLRAIRSASPRRRAGHGCHPGHRFGAGAGSGRRKRVEGGPFLRRLMMIRRS